MKTLLCAILFAAAASAQQPTAPQMDYTVVWASAQQIASLEAILGIKYPVGPNIQAFVNSSDPRVEAYRFSVTFTDASGQTQTLSTICNKTPGGPTIGFAWCEIPLNATAIQSSSVTALGAIAGESVSH